MQQMAAGRKYDLSFPIGPVETKMHGPYQRGERLLYEKPWIFVVSEKTRDKICNHCFQSLISQSPTVCFSEEPGEGADEQKAVHWKPELKRCTGCGFNWYCGRECQRAGWKFIHKHECPVFKKALEHEETTIPLNIDIVRLCLQTIIRIKNDSQWDKPANGFPELPHRTFPNLMSHWEEIKADPREMDFIELMSNFFYKMFKGQDQYDSIIDPMELGIIYGKVRINNMTIFGTYGDKLGVGLYLSGSAIDHSCLPNACPSFSGTTINIHATEDVDSFENVRLSYLDQVYLSRPRRELLQKRYYFDCFCRACVDPSLDRRMNGLKCLSKNCDGVIHTDPFTFESNPCTKCGPKATKEQLEKLRVVLAQGQEIQAQISEAKKLEDHKRVLLLAKEQYALLTPVLHSTNSLVISTSLQIACSADVLGDYATAFQHFSQLIDSYTLTFPYWSFQFAEICMKYTTRGLIVRQAPRDQKALLPKFVEAMKVIEVCTGRDSPTFAYYKKFYDDCREM